MVKAQIEPDGSLPTNVEQLRDLLMEITGGEIAGDNLFHSFDEFSVPNGMEAVFKNPSNIENIFARVTGGDISQIDGILSTQGAANLFLINPAGIVFGENASLNIGGSFIGTTADSVVFDDGKEFATNNESDPLLSVEVPVGLGFGSDNLTGAIAVDGNGNNITDASSTSPTVVENSQSGLSVKSGETLSLIGGDITIDGGFLQTDGGSIELGSVTTGTVDIQEAAFDYSEVDNYQDISLSNQSVVNSNGESAGEINLTGNNIAFSEGSLALIQNIGGSTSGNLNITAKKSLNFSGSSVGGESARSLRTEALESGRGSDINIFARDISTQDRSGFGTAAYDAAEGGDINVNASNSVNILNGGGFGAFTYGSSESGNLTLSTQQLKVTGGGQISTTTIGTGGGGTVTVDANLIELFGVSDTGGTPSLLGTSTFVTGIPGDVTVNTSKLRLKSGGFVSSNSLADGSTGNVTINASDSIEVIGRQEPFSSTIGSSVVVLSDEVRDRNNLPDTPQGLAGSTTINSPFVNVAQNGEITVRNEGSGNAGTLFINAENINLNDSGSITAESAFGQGGNIELDTDTLQVDDNSTITAEAGNQGDGGNITINASNILAKKSSAVSANAIGGDGGNIDVDAVNLFLEAPIDEIFSASSELGIDGTVEIEANQDFEGSFDLITPDFEIAEKALQGSCFTSRNSQQGSFVYGGTGGLPVSPDSMVEEEESTSSRLSQVKPGLPQPNPLETKPDYMYPEDYEWQPGDPIIEPTDLVKTKDGRLLWVNRHVSKDDLVCR